MVMAHHITTAQQLLEAGDIGRCELIRGDVVMMSPAGGEHGRIIVNVATPLANHVNKHGLGVVYGAETGFVIERDPDTVRAPDVAFIRTERVDQVATRKYIPGAPDLAVEVLSPDDRAGDLTAKVQQWLTAGCGAVWVVDPDNQTVTVYQKTGQTQLLKANDQLTGGDVASGFAVGVGDIFGGLGRPADH